MSNPVIIISLSLPGELKTWNSNWTANDIVFYFIGLNIKIHHVVPSIFMKAIFVVNIPVLTVAVSLVVIVT